MPRLPTPGGDDGTWGFILNDFLGQVHNTDGSLKTGIIGAANIADATITEAKLSSAVQTKLNSIGSVTSVNSQTGAVTLTKADVGLANADNTSDANKPISTATQTALDLKVDEAITVNGQALSSNVTLVKSDIGLANVDNTSDANKPVSSATQTALNAKADDAAVVHNTGAETVAGVKTFSSSPVVPTPSAGTDAANKTYVDSAVGGGGPVLWGGISGTLSNQSDLQTALDAKVDESTTVNGQALSSNVTLTKSDVGLANADNTSDANKPISTATQTALDLKVDESITVSGGTSLTGGGDLTTNRTLTLVNDAATPGNTQYYGTDGTGTKGYHAIPTQDPTMGGDLSGTASNAQIVANAVGTTEIANSAVTDGKIASGVSQAKITNLTTDLAAKLDDKNETVTLTDSTNDKFVRVDINDDASPTSGWIDRLAFYFSGTRTGYHNEYGELRARPAKNNTVALRAMGWNGASSAYILEVANNSSSTTYFGVTSTQIDATLPISSNSNITTTGTVNGSNIGAKVTTSSTAPSSPSVGDVWVDTST